MEKIRKVCVAGATTLAESVQKSDNVMRFDSVVGLAIGEWVDVTIDRIGSDGKLTPIKKEFVVGQVTEHGLQNVVRGKSGTTAQPHDAGAVVEFSVMSRDQQNDMVDALKNTLDGASGELKAGVVGEAAIAEKAVTAEKLAEKAVTSQNIDWGTVDTYTRGSFTRMGSHSVTKQEITSKTGLRYILDNGAGRIITKDGLPTKVRYYKFSSVMHYDGATSRPTTLPGIGPFDEGGKVWTRVYAGESQTSGAVAGQEFTATGSPFLGLVETPKKFSTANNYEGLIISFEAFWLRPGAWKIFGNLSATGAKIFLSFEAETAGIKENYCPSIYWRSLDQSNTNNCVFTYEFNDAIE